MRPSYSNFQHLDIKSPHFEEFWYGYSILNISKIFILGLLVISEGVFQNFTNVRRTETETVKTFYFPIRPLCEPIEQVRENLKLSAENRPILGESFIILPPCVVRGYLDQGLPEASVVLGRL